MKNKNLRIYKFGVNLNNNDYYTVFERTLKSVSFIFNKTNEYKLNISKEEFTDLISKTIENFYKYDNDSYKPIQSEPIDFKITQDQVLINKEVDDFIKNDVHRISDSGFYVMDLSATEPIFYTW